MISYTVCNNINLCVHDYISYAKTQTQGLQIFAHYLQVTKMWNENHSNKTANIRIAVNTLKKNVSHFKALKRFLFSSSEEKIFYIYLKWSSLVKADLTKKLILINMNIIFHTEIQV